MPAAGAEQRSRDSRAGSAPRLRRAGSRARSSVLNVSAKRARPRASGSPHLRPLPAESVRRSHAPRPLGGRAGRGGTTANTSRRQRGRRRLAERPVRRSVERGEARDGVARIHQRRQARGIGRIARQVGDQPVAQGQAAAPVGGGQHLDLHLRHVDAGRAFAPAALAGDAQLHRLQHLVGGERVGSELAGDGEPQRVGAAARHVALVAGDAEGRAHDAAGVLAAFAVVVAHLDRALETAAGARIGRPVERRLASPARDSPA